MCILIATGKNINLNKKILDIDKVLYALIKLYGKSAIAL